MSAASSGGQYASPSRLAGLSPHWTRWTLTQVCTCTIPRNVSWAGAHTAPCSILRIVHSGLWCGQRRSGQVDRQDSASARTSVLRLMRACGITAPPPGAWNLPLNLLIVSVLARPGSARTARSYPSGTRSAGTRRKSATSPAPEPRVYAATRPAQPTTRATPSPSPPSPYPHRVSSSGTTHCRGRYPTQVTPATPSGRRAASWHPPHQGRSRTRP